jgi:hypothetical protein
MGIFMTLFIIGFFLTLLFSGLSFLGDFDLFGDIDADLDSDFDADLDLDADIDIDADLDIDGDIDGIDGGVDGVEHLAGFSFLSPYVISYFLMGVGMGGTFLEETFDLSDPALYGGALVIGIATMLILQKILRTFFVDSQANNLVQNKDFPGLIGVVTLRIPEGDIGEVALRTRSGTIKMAARAEQFLPLGTKVKVVEKLGSFLRVVPVGKVMINEKMESSESPENGSGEQSTDQGSPAEVESEFTFDAYRKKEEAKKPTIIYDQRNITINDSVINRSDFGPVGGAPNEEKPTSVLKKEMKKKLANEIFADEDVKEQ